MFPTLRKAATAALTTSFFVTGCGQGNDSSEPSPATTSGVQGSFPNSERAKVASTQQHTLQDRDLEIVNRIITDAIADAVQTGKLTKDNALAITKELDQNEEMQSHFDIAVKHLPLECLQNSVSSSWVTYRNLVFDPLTATREIEATNLPKDALIVQRFFPSLAEANVYLGSLHVFDQFEFLGQKLQAVSAEEANAYTRVLTSRDGSSHSDIAPPEGSYIVIALPKNEN